MIKSFPNNAIDGNSDCLTISPLIEYVSAPEYHLILQTEKDYISIGSLIFGLTHKRVGDNRFGYKYSRITTYNENHYPYRIVPSEIEPMRFVDMNHHDEYSDKLLFAIGKRHILISADDVNLTIGLTRLDVDNNTWIDFDNSVLINQILK